jgi:hypothetical protein
VARNEIECSSQLLWNMSGGADTFIYVKADRMARSTKDFLDIIDRQRN